MIEVGERLQIARRPRTPHTESKETQGRQHPVLSQESHVTQDGTGCDLFWCLLYVRDGKERGVVGID